MSSFRYGSSFIISSALYAGLGYSLLALTQIPKVAEKKTEKVIKVAILAPTPKVVAPVPLPAVIVPPKKVEKPKPKKVVKKVIKKPKPKPKKIVKKVKPKPKPKKVIEEVYEEIYTEPIITETTYTAPTPQLVKQRVAQAVVTTPQMDLGAKKRAFLNKVRHAIHANKKYPKMAKRRNIQGTVHAIFDIQSNGTAINMRLSGASDILQKAVRKSILRSFPFSIPSELREKFPMVDVSVNVDFVLE